MGTSNFYNQNTSHIFAIENDEEWIVDNVAYSLKELDSLTHDICKIEFVEDDSIDMSSLRSFPSSSIGRMYKRSSYYGIDFEVEIILIVTSGYYEGANFDYIVNIETNGESYETIDDVILTLSEYPEEYTEYPGLVKANINHIEKWLKSELDYLTKNYENVLMMHTNPLEVFAQFNNGETFYREIA